MEYRIVLLTLVFSMIAQHCIAKNMLCYLRRGASDANLCVPPHSDVQCCPKRYLDNIEVIVYTQQRCVNSSQCKTGDGCCTRTNLTNVSEDYKAALLKSFIDTNCFNNLNIGFIINLMPNSTGLDLVEVSYNCTDRQLTLASISTEEATTKRSTADIFDTSNNTTKEKSSYVAAAVAVPLTIVVVGAGVVGTIFYVRRRRSRKGATEQRQEIHTNNAYIGSVSRSVGLHQNAHPSIKAEDQDSNHYYADIADNSVHFNHSSTDDNEFQPIKPNKRTATNGPPTNSYSTGKDSTGEDEYDHLGTQDTPSSRADNYEHITHISKDDCHSILYDKNDFNQRNTNSLGEEGNYNHARQNGATGRTEKNGRDGGYSHADGTVDGTRADDQYSTLESVLDIQDSSRHLNNYFVLEKQY